MAIETTSPVAMSDLGDRASTFPRKRKRLSGSALIGRVLLYVLLCGGGLAMIIPFLWMVLTSLKTPSETSHFTWLPAVPQWGNYADALAAAPFARYFGNSLIITVGETVLTLVFATAAGYALAKLPVGRKKFLMGYVIGLLMIPFQVVLVPMFLVVKSLPFAGGNDILGQGGTGWLDSYWGLIIPLSIGPLYIFLARQFYTSLPDELADAARIDGLGEYAIFARIMTPLIMPALVTIAVFQIEAGWNSFIWPLVITHTQSLRPLQLGLAIFAQDPLNIQWNYLMAGATLATVPMVILFIFAQRYFIQGISGSGIKG